MKSYCVKEKRETESVPGTEQMKTASNGRRMMLSKCFSCGIMKTKFLPSSGPMTVKRGGAVPAGGDFSCGYNLKGKRPGTIEECFKKGQIRRYGVELAEDLDDLIYDREVDRQRKRATTTAKKGKKRKTKKKEETVWTKEKQKEYVDENVADIKKGKLTAVVQTRKNPSPQFSRKLLQTLSQHVINTGKIDPTRKIYNINNGRKKKPTVRQFKTPENWSSGTETATRAPEWLKKHKKRLLIELRGVVLKKLINNENKTNYFVDIVIDKLADGRYRVREEGQRKSEGRKLGQGDTIRYLISLADDSPVYEEALEAIIIDWIEDNRNEFMKIIGQVTDRMREKGIPEVYQVGSNIIQYYRR